MPKVLRIVNRFNLGGPTYNAAYLSKYLYPEFETLLIGGLKDDSEESSEFILKNLGVAYRIIPEMRRKVNLWNDWIAYRKIQSIIRDYNPDIVHTHAAKAGALGRQAAFSCNIPVTVHTFHGHVFHSYFSSFKTSFYKHIERNLAKRTSAIIAISEKQKQELVGEHKIAPTEKVCVIPLGFDLKRFTENTEEKRKDFRAKYNLSEDDIAIGIVGRLVPIKNHSLFIDAIKFVDIHSKKKIQGFIIGDGESRMFLENKVSSLGISHKVVFTSWEKEVDKVYHGLDIVCMTSLNEGTPVSLIEAQAAGKPIVTTNIGGIKDTVLPGETALLADVHDREKFFSNLLKLVEDKSARDELSYKGRAFVNQKFNYLRLVSDVKNLYCTLLG